MRSCWLAILATMLCATMTTGVVLTREERKIVNSFIFRLKTIGRLNTVSVSIVKEGDTVYAETFGYTDHAETNRADSDTVFCLSSMTETFTSALLAKLLARHNNYTWDTRVSEILGDDFQLVDEYVSRHVTLRDVMAHRTGVTSMDGIIEHRAATSEQIIERLGLAPQVHPFRATYHHSKVMMAVIQAVVEKIGESDWATLISQYILRPLDITRSTYFIKSAGIPLNTFALPKLKSDLNRTTVPWDITRLLGTIPAGSGLCSSSYDMGRWMKFHLAKGRSWRGSQIYHENWLSETYHPQVMLSPDENFLSNVRLGQNSITFDTRDSVGFGWTNGYFGSYRTLSSSGSWYGYETYMSMLPERQLGIWLAFTGISGKKAEALKRLTTIYLSDLLLRGNSTFYNDKISMLYDRLSRLIPRRKPIEAISTTMSGGRPKDIYVGTYGNAMFGYLNISLCNCSADYLYLDYGDMKLGGYFLVPTGLRDEFYMHPRAGPLTIYTRVFVDGETPVVYFNVSEPEVNSTAAPTTTTRDETEDGKSTTEMPENEKEDEVSVVSVIIPDFDALARPEFFKDFDIDEALKKARSSYVKECPKAKASISRSNVYCFGVVALVSIVIRFHL